MEEFYGRVRYIKVRLTGPDDIGGTRIVRYGEGIVISRFFVQRFTCADIVQVSVNAHLSP